MKKLLFIIFAVVFTSCGPAKKHYIIKVHYCNKVDFNRDSIFEITTQFYPEISTYRESVPVIYRQNDSKIVNVCAFEILKVDTIK